MFAHHKKPLFPVKVGEVNPRFAQKLLEQFGGRSGEFTAMTEYFVQSFACTKPASATCCWTSPPRRSATSRWSA